MYMVFFCMKLYVNELSAWEGCTEPTSFYNIKTFITFCSYTFYHFTVCIKAFGLYVVHPPHNRNLSTVIPRLTSDPC